MNLWIRASAMLWAALLLVCNPTGAAAREGTPGTVPRYEARTLFESTSARGASFSPDESTLLLTSDATGVFNAYTVPVAGGPLTALTKATDDGLYTRSFFPKDRRVLLSRDAGGNEITHLLVRELDGSIRDLTPGPQVRARFLDWSEDGTSFFALTNEQDPQKMDVWRFRVGPATEAAAQAEGVERYTRDLVANNPGGHGVGSISRDGRWLLLQKVHSNANSDLYLWDLKHPASDPEHITPHEGAAQYEAARFTPDSKALYYTSDEGSEFARLWSMDLGTRKRTLVAEAPWDIMNVQFSDDGRWRLIRVNADAQSQVLLHDRRAGTDVALENVPAGQFQGGTFSPSGTLLAFYVSTDRAPADLYVADLPTGRIRQLTQTRNPAVDPAHLVDAEVVRYPSFDKLEIPALLYRPHGASKEHPVPALLWVHGGPGGQSRRGYRPMLQYLINHGYAILAVNNRGSSGYGKTFHHLDDRRHGDVDLKDCIWGRRYLESLPWIDGSRVGIMGGSYGGYMTVAALAFAPDAFDMGIDIFGVTNWLRTLKSIPPWWASFRKALYDEIGDPETDEERLRAHSPLFHADKIRKPLLVIQGANDPRVLKAESDEIVAAVKKNGVPVEYLLFEDEGHGFRKRENRIRAAEVSLAFARRHLRSTAPEMDTKRRAALDAQVRPYIEAKRIVGVVIGTLDKDRVYVQGYGRVSPDREEAPDGDTLFEIGSISKVFTGVLLASLVQEGALTLDQEVRTLLPEEVKLTPMNGVPMTLRQLSTHTSGLPRMPGNFRPGDPANPYADYSVAQLHEALLDVPARKPPGTGYAYSNLGTGLLGHLLARRAGADYEALLLDRIARPLGMASTRVRLDEALRGRLAPPFDASGRPASGWDLGLFVGAGGIRSSVNDMLRFARAQWSDADNPLQKALRLAQAQVPVGADGRMRMGLGWHVQGDGWLLHNGQTGGYHSFLAVDPKHQRAVVLLSNSATSEIDAIGNALGRVLMGQDVPVPTVAPRIRVEPRLLEEYAGRYQLQPGFVIEVTIEKGVLHLQATGQPRIPTEPRSPTRFWNEAAGAEVEFERDEKGAVVRLLLRQGGRTMPAPRLAD